MYNLVVEPILLLMQPLGMLWAVLIGYAVWLYRRQRKQETVFITCLVAFIWLIGATPLPGLLMASLERPYAGLELEEIPEADAVILLGGGSTPARYEAVGMSLGDSGNRIIMAYELMLTDHAPVLLVGEGLRIRGAPWQTTKKWFATGKLPEERLIAMPPSRNTHDEAVFVGKIAKTNDWDRLLLVTSAGHMRRAAATFRTQGLNIYEVPCDFKSVVGRYGRHRFGLVPTVGGFKKIPDYVHEIAGWYYYRLRGRINSEAAGQKTPSFKQ